LKSGKTSVKTRLLNSYAVPHRCSNTSLTRKYRIPKGVFLF
jgi:hypothetical protein